jgi:hypothetical protein
LKRAILAQQGLGANVVEDAIYPLNLGATFPEAGMVGLWTKADSVTVFNGFTYGERR